MESLEMLKALSNKSRLQLLELLKDPEGNFPEQAEHGYKNGVCVGQLQSRMGLTQSTVSEYLASLQRAGFITATRVGQWTYYKRDEAAFRKLADLIRKTI